MKSVKDIFVLGPGPSSSHTIGPFNIAEDYKKSLAGKEVVSLEVTLYQSLAFTGRGHLTDKVIMEVLKEYHPSIKFDINTLVSHPNTLRFVTVFKNGTVDSAEYISYGGGVFGRKGEEANSKEVYPFKTFEELFNLMELEKTDDIFTIILKYEGLDILSFGLERTKQMFQVVQRGLEKEGVLPGSLKLKRVAKGLEFKAKLIADPYEKNTVFLSSYAYSCAEENASGNFVITAPTCGSCGVVPSVMYYEFLNNHLTLEEIAKAVLVGGLVGNFVKANASISGAVHGCQAEIGTASCMASAALCYLNKLSSHQIEYGSEVAMEHFLGLTCDPVDGYVQIPCIERNAMASIHAYSSYLFAKDISPLRHNEVSFDNVVKAMKATGDSLSVDYKETSIGGLAEFIKS